MKLAIVVLAIVALASGSPAVNNIRLDAKRDITPFHVQDFIDLINIDEMVLIVFVHLNDPQVQQLFNGVMSPEFASFVYDVSGTPEYLDFVNLCENNGLNIKRVINAIHELLGVPTPWGAKNAPNQDLGGINGLIDAIINSLPRDDLRALYEYKVANYQDFNDLLALVHEPEVAAIQAVVVSHSYYAVIIDSLEGNGVNVARIIELVRSFFGLA